jgi:hypothetical protein
MIRTFTVIEPKKNRKKTWDTYYRTARVDSATTWISELAITDQKTIFNHMEVYTTDNQDSLLQARTDNYWGRRLKKVQKHFNNIQEPFRGVQGTIYIIPLLLSFPNGFTEDNIADIMQWYRQMVVHTAPRDLPWNLPNFVEQFKIKLPELAEFEEALRKVSKKKSYPGQHHKNHFVFKGYNIFFESQQLLMLYDYQIHIQPTVYKAVHSNCRRKLNMVFPEQFRTAIAEGVRDITKGELRELNMSEKERLLADLRKRDDCPEGWKNIDPEKQTNILHSLDDHVYEITRIVQEDEIETIIQEGGKNRYERVLSNGARVECQSNGDIIAYKPPPMSPKKAETKQKE